MGVQQPCQRAQGQAGDRREGVKWRAQTTARTDTNAPRGNWERQQKNNDGQSSSCSHKYHRAGRSAAVFASRGAAPLPPPTQPAAEGGPGLQPAGTSKRAAQGTSCAAPGHPPVHLVSDVPQHGEGFQGNLKLHRLRLLLQLLRRGKHRLRISGPVSLELRGGSLLAAHQQPRAGEETKTPWNKLWFSSGLQQRCFFARAGTGALAAHPSSPCLLQATGGTGGTRSATPWKRTVPDCCSLPPWHHLVARQRHMRLQERGAASSRGQGRILAQAQPQSRSDPFLGLPLPSSSLRASRICPCG